MSWQRSIQAAVRALKKEEDSLKGELTVVQRKITELEGLARHDGARGPRRANSQRLSPKGREAISRAAKKRWAEYRRQQKR
jgi:hypothetical protein